jgi:hypothetical protein
MVLAPDAPSVGAQILTHRIPAMEGATLARGYRAVDCYSRDRHAILGRVDGIDGLYLATAFSGSGFKIAPAGRRVHGRADRGRPGEDGRHRRVQSPAVRRGEIARGTVSVRDPARPHRPLTCSWAPTTLAERRSPGFARERIAGEEVSHVQADDNFRKELRDLMGTPSERAIKKESPFIDAPSREFIAHAPFLLLATSDATGRCDVSPKGDAPGFVRVLDERHLVIPDRPGNKRLDGLRNLIDNPHVGLIFLIPGARKRCA